MKIRDADMTEFGEPEDAAESIVDAILNESRSETDGKAQRLMLGQDCLARARIKLRSLKDSCDATDISSK